MNYSKNKLPTLSAADVYALLTALPLVCLAYTDTPVQAQTNALLVESVSKKLEQGVSKIDINEIRIIYLALLSAIGCCSGNYDDVIDKSEISPDWQAELSRNLFVYTRLLPHFAAYFPDT